MSEEWRVQHNNSIRAKRLQSYCSQLYSLYTLHSFVGKQGGQLNLACKKEGQLGAVSCLHGVLDKLCEAWLKEYFVKIIEHLGL